MHVAKHTPDQLVLTDSGATLRMIGAFLLVFGAIFVYSGMQQSMLALPPIIIGSLAALGGIAFVVLPGRVIAAFDKPSHTLIITRRSVRGYTRDEVDFSRITDVTTESSQIGRGGTTWRVAIVLKDGTRIPLTSWYSSSPLHQVAADAAEQFLGIAPSATGPAGASQYGVRLALRHRQHAQSRGSIGCMMLFCGIFLAVGGTMTYVVASRLITWLPISATVVGTRITTVRGSKGGVSYRPDISYRYEAGGRSYIGTHATILNESRSYGWANGIVRRFPNGAEVTAYIDPANFARSYLIHEWSFFPMLFTAIPLVAMLSLLWTLRQMPPSPKPGSDPAAPVAPGSGTT
jgi:hypothetical protein